MSDHYGIFTQFFLEHEMIFSSHTMFINALDQYIYDQYSLNVSYGSARNFHCITSKWLAAI